MSKNNLIITILFPLMVSCASPWKSSQGVIYPESLQSVVQLVSEGQSDQALAQINQYINQVENLEWYGHAYYLQGRVYHGQGQIDQAVDSYRKAIRQSLNFDAIVEANSLYQLSLVYEQSGRYGDLVPVLVDLMKRTKHFSTLVARVHIPARLAAAYAHQDNLEQARQYHQRAAQAFSKISAAQADQLSGDDMAQSHFYLGLAIYPPECENFRSLQQKLDLGQRHLLASSEWMDSPWGQKAKDSLGHSYDKLWHIIRQHPKDNTVAGDPGAQLKQQQMQQVEMASDFYDLALRLQEYRHPRVKQKPGAQAILNQGQKHLRELEKFVAQLSLGPELIRSHRVKNKPLPTQIRVNSPELLKDSTPSPSPTPAEANDIGTDPNL
jgi:tetratricopeptide (TPR) repeat protein